jgi:GMP synthase-like glutamine amidotransferase
MEQRNGFFLSRVLAFTRVAIACGTPIIGICLGHQIIARALNGKVIRGANTEVGIRRIYAALSQDSGATKYDGMQAFVFHQDRVPQAPPDCIVTFRSERCAVEGFRHREQPVHGLQFHPEIGCRQARSILRWWYAENSLNTNKLDDVETFDEKPVRQLLLSLITQYTNKTTI